MIMKVGYCFWGFNFNLRQLFENVIIIYLSSVSIPKFYFWFSKLFIYVFFFYWEEILNQFLPSRRKKKKKNPKYKFLVFSIYIGILWVRVTRPINNDKRTAGHRMQKPDIKGRPPHGGARWASGPLIIDRTFHMFDR